MKLSILQNKLKRALNVIESITSKSPSLPILGNVLLETKGNFLKLSSTNLETGIIFWILAKIEKEGRVTVPARVFSSFINYLSSPSVLNLETKQEVLSLECGQTKTKINGLNPQDFPIIPQVEKNEQFSLKSSFLTESLSQLISIVSLSTIRPEISGIYFNLKKNILTMAATDSFRLGEKKVSLNEGLVKISKDHNLILPQRAASSIISIFGDKEEDLDVYVSSSLIMIESSMEERDHPKIQFISKLIEGEYPKYQEIIPHKLKTESIIERKEFLSQLKRASLFTSRINEVKLKFSPKAKVEVFCQNPDLGEYSSVFPGEIKGAESEVSFNYKFLLDGLSNIRKTKISFGLSGNREAEEGPAILKPVDDKTYLYVVMPIQPT